MTELVLTIITLIETTIRFNGFKTNVILLTLVTGKVLREEKRNKAKLITLKTRYIWLYASHLLA